MKKMSIGKRILAASAFALVLSSVAMATPKTIDFGEEDLECRTVSWSFLGFYMGDSGLLLTADTSVPRSGLRGRI